MRVGCKIWMNRKSGGAGKTLLYNRTNRNPTAEAAVGRGNRCFHLHLSVASIRLFRRLKANAYSSTETPDADTTEIHTHRIRRLSCPAWKGRGGIALRDSARGRQGSIKVHLDRTACGHLDHSHPRVHAFAGAGERKKKGKDPRVYGPVQTDRR